jgi:hypothetical protein
MSKRGIYIKNPVYVTEVFFTLAFFVKDHFPEYNILHRCNVNWTIGRFFNETIFRSPREGCIAIARIKVGFKSGWDVNQIEMATAVTSNLGGDQICGRAVKVGLGKKGL